MEFDWTAEIAARMHMENVTGRQLAKRAGITNTYLSAVLHKKKSSDVIRQRIEDAMTSIEQEHHAGDANK